jgi:hypothetical protein
MKTSLCQHSYPFKCLLFLAIVLMGLLSGLSAADPALNDDMYQLPAGAMVPVILQDEISTEHATVGQSISAMVAQDVYVNTRKIFSRSDRLLGSVTWVQPPIEGRNAVLKIAFDTLIVSSGIKIPFLALVDTGKENHTWGGELTPGTKPVIVPYNIESIGTYGRIMYQGPRAVGKHFNISPGTRLNAILQEPVSLYTY